MAGKKPAKVNAANKKEKLDLPGRAIYYMGAKNASGFTCPTCNKSLLKGIIYEYTDGNSYCSRGCIPKQEIISSS